MGKFRNIEQIGNQLAHHLTGIVVVVVGEGQLLVMVKELLAHIPLHVGAHHVALVADVVFAQRLNHIHGEHPGSDERKGAQYGLAAASEKSPG